MGNVLINTSNSRPIYKERVRDPNIKPSDCIYYGLTKSEYDEWCERVHKILDSNNFDDFPEPDIKIVFK